ncbi:hypothetical protein E4T56_gene11131 [Termitomyces sp. T112]|nr:hypothetical protein E4T56_gene11131 [Termitomyces sp. T112]
MPQSFQSPLEATLPAAAPSPLSLGSPPHWTPAESSASPTPPIIAPLPPLTPPTAPYVLAALEAATVTPWWSPQQYLYPYTPSPVPSEPRPVPSEAHPSPPPPYELPPYMWPTTSSTPPHNATGKPQQLTMILPQTAQPRPQKSGNTLWDPEGLPLLAPPMPTC